MRQARKMTLVGHIKVDHFIIQRKARLEENITSYLDLHPSVRPRTYSRPAGWWSALKCSLAGFIFMWFAANRTTANKKRACDDEISQQARSVGAQVVSALLVAIKLRTHLLCAQLGPAERRLSS